MNAMDLERLESRPEPGPTVTRRRFLMDGRPRLTKRRLTTRHEEIVADHLIDLLTPRGMKLGALAIEVELSVFVLRLEDPDGTVIDPAEAIAPLERDDGTDGDDEEDWPRSPTPAQPAVSEEGLPVDAGATTRRTTVAAPPRDPATA